MLTTQLNLSDKQQGHYGNVYKQDAKLTLKVIKDLGQTDFSLRYLTKVVLVDNKKTRGNIVLEIRNDSLCRPLELGALIVTKNALTPFSKPANPGQFDYQAYMKRKRLFDKLRTSGNHLIMLSQGRLGIWQQAQIIQKKFVSIIDQTPGDNQSKGVLKALLFGFKLDLDPETKSNFSKAGVMHLLAVSGLHVGIVMLLTSRLLFFLRGRKSLITLRLLLVLLTLWGFALITGFSASVVRASFMFSLLAITLHLKRGYNSINALFISMFIMLLLDPNRLFQIGFQLSYAAVLSILSLYPKLSGLWVSKYYLLRKFWQLSSLSISAQLGVLPLSLYYFHDFPSLFLVSNLIIIPAIGLFMSYGLIICLLKATADCPDVAFEFLLWAAKQLQSIVSIISQWEGNTLAAIHLNKWQVIALYGLAIFTWICIKKTPKYWLRWLSAALLSFMILLYAKKRQLPDTEWVIYNQYASSLMSYKNGNHLTVWKDTLDSTYSSLADYTMSRRVSEVDHQNWPNYIAIGQKEMVIISRPISGYDQLNSAEVLLLRNSPKINLERLIEAINPRLIIADGSNYKSVVKRWRKSAKKMKIPLYSTYESGAFIWSE